MKIEKKISRIKVSSRSLYKYGNDAACAFAVVIIIKVYLFAAQHNCKR